MPDSADFKSLAERCFELADNVQAPDDRTVLLDMGQAWLDLATEEEEVTKLVREADVAFEIRTSNTARGAPLWAMDLSAPPSDWESAPSPRAA
jgi:hypothetical protein